MRWMTETIAPLQTIGFILHILKIILRSQHPVQTPRPGGLQLLWNCFFTDRCTIVIETSRLRIILLRRGLIQRERRLRRWYAHAIVLAELCSHTTITPDTCMGNGVKTMLGIVLAKTCQLFLEVKCLDCTTTLHHRRAVSKNCFFPLLRTNPHGNFLATAASIVSAKSAPGGQF